MGKLSLVASPTFKATVQIPVAGSAFVPVEFTFKHRGRDALAAFQELVPGQEDEAIVADMICGWGLEEAFTLENVSVLLDNHLGAGTAIYGVYIEELVKHKAKN